MIGAHDDGPLAPTGPELLTGLDLRLHRANTERAGRQVVGEYIGADRPLAAIALSAVILVLLILGHLNRDWLSRRFE